MYRVKVLDRTMLRGPKIFYDSVYFAENKQKQFKDSKNLCESNQILEFCRQGSPSVVLINPIPGVLHCPFSMLRCAVL